ncbi:MAG TPA: indolepyruvate ferredoxin oxidoreductase [Desulfonatronum sp.]|nr:indolepyruvate ferredoxin oxidoreductase [Desulfonatronum sp.]
MSRLRVFFTGVGGQGTVTATRLLAQSALDEGIPVVAGEVHGMAQRGGIVESTVLMGGYVSPRICRGEADVLLGFEPMETLRALPYLAMRGLILCSTDPLPPLGVCCGREQSPGAEDIRRLIRQCTQNVYFLACRELGAQAGAEQAGNLALLGALQALGRLPFGLDRLEKTVAKLFSPKLVDVNLKALSLGAEAVAQEQ